MARTAAKKKNVDEIVESFGPNEVEIKWGGYPIKVKKYLSFEEMVEFVNTVVENCFISDGEYHPEIYDVLLKMNVLIYYTDLGVPTETSRLYDLVERTDLIDEVSKIVNPVQWEEIRDAIDRKISYYTYTSARSSEKRMDEVTGKIDSLVDDVGDMFKDISSEDLVNIAGAMKDGKIDEGKLADAYIGSMKVIRQPTTAKGKVGKATTS